MNVFKPLIIYNVTHSITLMTDGCANFRKFLVEGTKPNLKKIGEYVETVRKKHLVVQQLSELAERFRAEPTNRQYLEKRRRLEAQKARL